ncbi:putative aminopeptidase P [Rickettsia hoogstraalii str. RCCE3]|nr:putative aminopeptidase P [Rickettsia hoogstraalii str. RCCE3]
MIKERVNLLRSLFTEIDEINYIKEYYNKIRAKIYDLLSPQARDWLNNEINLFLQSLL